MTTVSWIVLTYFTVCFLGFLHFLSADVYKIGVILPFEDIKEPWALPRGTKAGIEYAVETVNRSKNILPNHKFSVTFGDSKCSDTYGPLAAIDMYINKTAQVFLGPACDYAVAPIARFSPHWNIPVITGGAFVHAFKDKENQYHLLTRIGGSYEKLGEFFVTVFEEFGWFRPGFFFHNNLGDRSHLGKSNCFFIMEGVYIALNRRYGSHRRKMQKKLWVDSFDENTKYNTSFILREVSNNARVVVLCASPDSVRDIMIKAKELNFDNGEYVFFNIDLFSSKTEREQPWKRVNDSDERNEKAKSAYESLMTVTLRKPESPEYKNFSEEVKRRAKSEYGNIVYADEEVNSFVGAFHDAVILYALALNETLEAGESASNGTEITKRMWNRTFQGITGTVSIDENGDRNADYSLLDMDPKTGNFEVVANYYGSRKIYEPVEGKVIHWAGGKTSAPPDTPECGFDYSGCPQAEPFPEYAIVIIVLGSLLIIVSIVAFFVYKHYQEEIQLAEVNWRVKWDDIFFGGPKKKKVPTATLR